MAYDMRWMGINTDGEGEVWFWNDSVCKISKDDMFASEAER